MKRLLRAFRFAAHVAVSVASLVWFACARRGAVLVFTHAPDLDRDGRDPQMGPLVEALRARGLPLVEVTFVSLDRGLLENLRRKRRPFVSYAVLAALVRIAVAFGMGPETARRRVGGAFLGLLAPRCVFAIDESGSGQLLVQGARQRGIRSVGIQHGDFQPANPQYARACIAGKGVAAADVLCLWSPWFRARLLCASPIYDERNTLVTGRMRFPRPATPARRARSARPRVLLLAESSPAFRELVRPFLELTRDADLEVEVRPHPADPAGVWQGQRLATGSLEDALELADVVVGVGSSALLEACWARRPVVLLSGDSDPDPAGYVREGIGSLCSVPADLPELCRKAAASGPDPALRERIWGAEEPTAVLQAILGAAGCDRSTQAW
jgi:hypothetical protein